VTTEAAPGESSPEDYVFVDWGPEFRANHHNAFPDAPSPVLSVNHGPLALDYILAVGGSGYFRMEAARPHLEAGRLRLVPDRPRFAYSIYALYSAKADEQLMARVRNGLRAVAVA
jgi:DNA-binding transcriptional LysR family regulator